MAFDVKSIGSAMKSLLAATAMCIVACGPEMGTIMEPDIHDSNLPVTLQTWVRTDAGSSELSEFRIGPESARQFIEMLAQSSAHTRISEMPADPMGHFYVGETEYAWHGNAVIRGEGRHERLWHGPYLQNLINALSRDGYEVRTRDAVQTILDELEAAPGRAGVKVEGPGVYPGGG